MKAGVEVELKLQLDARDAARLARARALAGVRPRTVPLHAIYFDTPQLLLRGQGMVLRLRRQGDRWVEALKARQSGAGGLQRRQEWEHERSDPVLDLAHFRDTPLAGLAGAERLHLDLHPAFHVEVERTIWVVAPRRGVRLEVALDQGEVRAGTASEAICEVEIECLEGGPAAAFELAAALLREVPLLPSATTKAERGYRLFDGRGREPRKVRPGLLHPGMGRGEAARALVAAGVDAVQANVEGLVASDDPEFVHQARIALRRLRATLRLFRVSTGKRRADAWRNQLRNIARSLGAARELDVFAAQTLPALLRDYGDTAAAASLVRAAGGRRAKARTAARRSVRLRRYGRTLLAITQWLAAEAHERAGDANLGKFSRRAVTRRHQQLLRAAADVASLTVEQRHRLRLAAKKLRYSADALAPALEARGLGEYLDTLSDLQDVLGEANDAATALGLIDALGAPPELLRFARERLGRASAGDVPRLHELLRKLDHDLPRALR